MAISAELFNQLPITTQSYSSEIQPPSPRLPTIPEILDGEVQHSLDVARHLEDQAEQVAVMFDLIWRIGESLGDGTTRKSFPSQGLIDAHLVSSRRAERIEQRLEAVKRRSRHKSSSPEPIKGIYDYPEENRLVVIFSDTGTMVDTETRQSSIPPAKERADAQGGLLDFQNTVSVIKSPDVMVIGEEYLHIDKQVRGEEGFFELDQIRREEMTILREDDTFTIEMRRLADQGRVRAFGKNWPANGSEVGKDKSEEVTSQIPTAGDINRTLNLLVLAFAPNYFANGEQPASENIP